jgi:uncharacterized protein
MSAKTAEPVLDQGHAEETQPPAGEAVGESDGASGYELRVSRDKITVRLDCPDPHSQLAATVLQIMADFQKLEIPEFPDQETMTEILKDSCSPGEDLDDYAIIMGIEPVPTVDGSLEWARDFFAEGWKMDDMTGAVDFWEKLEERSVHEGELLVTLHHPVPGESGLNVFGNDIPVDKPVKVKLRCGKGVRIEEAETSVAHYATCDGRVRFADGTVSVDDLYVIKGNVDLEVGNIRHTGSVVIDGDIETGAIVEADGDILVKGMAESCDIRCGGSLTVAGGLLGSADCKTRVEGEIRAKYISEALIISHGNITVLNEIAHSDIRTLGKVIVEKGRIAGGVTVALRGIRVAEAGASGSTQTLLNAGSDFMLDEKIDALNQKIEDLEEAQKKINAAITKVRGRSEAKTAKSQAMLAEFSSKIKKIDAALGATFAKIDTVTQESLADAVEEVIILTEIWSGTTIQLGDYRLLVTKSISKPRLAQRRRHKVRLLPLGDGNMPDD